MRKKIPALKVSQWLSGWEEADFSLDQFRRKPPKQFFLFSMEASELRRLVGIQRRSPITGTPRSQDLAIQRAHEGSRSIEIADYVKYGFPWSKLSPRKRKAKEYVDLIKPGWLPTAIVVNILLPEDCREDKSVNREDLVTINLESVPAYIEVPDTTEQGWKLSGRLPPIEVIDGQHRLWAFDKEVDGYEVPVVAFHGLDRSWQAYLFYTINISPKKINSSLAYDLYPLLRTEDWLEKFEGHSIYRETRAQELTEAMWSHEKSPWYQRINMLGEPGKRSVTQASWIRSLLATFIKSWEGPRVQIGGLFGAPVGENELVLSWSRAQQAAFLIYAWRELEKAIVKTEPNWIKFLDSEDIGSGSTAGLESVYSMLNSDMGVRGVLFILNDLCFVRAEKLGLRSWKQEISDSATSDSGVTLALDSLDEQPVAEFVHALMETLAQYDWRSSKAPNLKPDERQAKARFRGGSGYRELRQELLNYIIESSTGDLNEGAEEVVKRLGL